MAKVQVSDVIVPEIFNDYVIERTAAKSALFRSGIIQAVPELGMVQGKGGKTVNMPFWKDLAGNSEILSDSAALTPAKTSADADIAVIHGRGKAWSSNDLAKQVSGDDPMAAIGNLVADYWNRDMQTILFQTLAGIFAAASMAGNLHDISGETTPADQFTAARFVDATQKLGDAMGGLTGMAVHSATYAQMLKDDLITFVQPSDGGDPIAMYQGREVIVDDGCPVSSGDYTTYLFGNGAIGYADAEHEDVMLTETDRDSLAGDDILITRKLFLMHPRGVKWGGTPAAFSPSNAELAVGTNWTRVFENKNVRIVAFVHALA